MKKSNEKIGIIYGTRPEIIKLAPIIWKCQADNIPFFCVHSGQHYSKEMDQIFFESLSLPEPEYRLDVGIRGLGGHGPTTGTMMTELEDIIVKEKPGVVFVQGDTNTALAGALVAAKIPYDTEEGRIKVAHVEAGLRSYDARMPEEKNRIIIDHISDFLLVPSEIQRQILLAEGIQNEKIHVVGNTIADAVTQIVKRNMQVSKILEVLGLNSGSYILLTLHRQENVDVKEILTDVFEGLKNVAQTSNMPIIFSTHPRTKKKMIEFGIEFPAGVITIEPTNYQDFLMLESNARIIMTDSGGVQEEACIFQVPCVTLRESTERPETVDVGANLVSGTNPEAMLANFNIMFGKKKVWKNPFGDGDSAHRIIDITRRYSD